MRSRRSRFRVAMRMSGAFAMVATAGLMTPAAAQTPKVEASVGYQYTHVPDLNFAAGWVGDVTANVNDLFGIVGEVSGAQTTQTEQISSRQSVDVSLRLLTYMGGVRVASHINPKVVPFVQVLMGSARFSGTANVPTTTFNLGMSESHFAMQSGGGVLLMINPRVGIRVGADYRAVVFEGGQENEFRVASGVVVALGK